ncbi:hypothetical protein MN116_003857 [Schistosoma mekongi]|uniref:Uncharacterized protein n=1 Tax=Schistosoma mekongi TaxID=38744 RepID=A0AAE1ZF09_SCHME|nr:hypothetical protein MN116_003857 [Schistosoma mekongi]
MKNYSTLYCLIIITLTVYCLMFPLIMAWKTDTMEISNDKEATNIGFENLPILFREMDPLIQQRKKWRYYNELPWIYEVKRNNMKHRLHKLPRRDRRFFCNPMGCV